MPAKVYGKARLRKLLSPFHAVRPARREVPRAYLSMPLKRRRTRACHRRGGEPASRTSCRRRRGASPALPGADSDCHFAVPHSIISCRAIASKRDGPAYRQHGLQSFEVGVTGS
jgi:hypothetical protein